MGGGGSTANTHAKKSIEEVVNVMMPVYYTDAAVTEEDFKIAQASWDMILNDTSPAFLELQKNPDGGKEYNSCIMFFYDTFYGRLFDVHPLCKPMFKSGMKAQGKALVKIVSLSLSMSSPEDKKKFDAVMLKLAEVHNDKGVKAVEYGIMGESLIWALSKCLGPDVFTALCGKAWIRIFCRMIKIMIPVAVAHEMDNGRAQQKRFDEQQRFAEEAEEKERTEKSKSESRDVKSE